MRVTRLQRRERIRTAYHEAGHAVIGYVNGFIPYRATIKAGANDTGSYLGEVRIKTLELNFILAHRLVAYMLFELAGIAAENRYSRRRLDDFEQLAAYEDIASFGKHWFELSILTDGLCPNDDEFKSEIIQLVWHYWSAIDAFARLLLERETIEHEELEAALETVTHDCEHLPLSCDDREWLAAVYQSRPQPFSRYADLERAASRFAAHFFPESNAGEFPCGSDTPANLAPVPTQAGPLTV